MDPFDLTYKEIEINSKFSEEKKLAVLHSNKLAKQKNLAIQEIKKKISDYDKKTISSGRKSYYELFEEQQNETEEEKLQREKDMRKLQEKLNTAGAVDSSEDEIKRLKLNSEQRKKDREDLINSLVKTSLSNTKEQEHKDNLFKKYEEDSEDKALMNVLVGQLPDQDTHYVGTANFANNNISQYAYQQF